MARTKTTDATLTRLLEQAPEPIYVVDERRAIVFCNAACARWTGVDAKSLVGRRVEYVAGDDAGGAPGVAAGLCPPPAAFAGEEVSGHVSCMSRGGRLLHRRARFVPLGRSPLDCVGVVAFVEGVDIEEHHLAPPDNREPTPDELHLAIRRFRAGQARRYAVAQLIGQSPGIRRARAAVALAASGGASTLVLGPPGSGRAHAARAIHYAADPKSAGRLVPLTCTLLEAGLLRSTLTAMLRAEPPDGPGTLLLMEVDELPDAAQALLADAIASGRKTPRMLGTARESLVALAEGGAFRHDLACALSTLEIRLPPLRDRLEDLPLLAHFFMEEVNGEGGKQLGSIAPEALDLLAACDWPRNLDELFEAIRTAHQAAEGHRIEVRDLPQRILLANAAAQFPRRVEEKTDLERYLASIETELILRALRRAAGNKSRAAELLGMTRPRFYRRLAQLGLAEGGDAPEEKGNA